MELFAPESLVGVGAGSVAAAAAIGGLLGMAAAIGLLFGEGWLGLLVAAAAGTLLLTVHNDPFGGPSAALVVLAAIALGLGAAHVWFHKRSAAERRVPTGALGAAAAAGLTLGVAWSEWEQRTFALDESALFAAIIAGIFAALAALGAHTFADGARRAGGQALIVGATLVIVALAAAAASLYVPFVGFAIALAAAVVALRMRRRSAGKYKGLRILT